jgi:hypothetical protein
VQEKVLQFLLIETLLSPFSQPFISKMNKIVYFNTFKLIMNEFAIVHMTTGIQVRTVTKGCVGVWLDDLSEVDLKVLE